MRAGSLNSRITIKKAGPNQDEIGQPIASEEIDVATVWASILHKSGSESIKADKDVSTVQASIRIRRRTDITAAMRVHHGSTVYEIKAVLPDEQNRDHVDLVCEVVT